MGALIFGAVGPSLLGTARGCWRSVVIKAAASRRSEFETRVTHPAYKDRHPKVLFDEAHNNFQTTQGGYRPFTELITNDGYAVTPNKQKFQQKLLAGYEILAIVDALGTPPPILPPTNKAAFIAEASKPAFTPEECEVVRSWVETGGSLLLASDHAPVGAAMANLSEQFGVEMSKVYTFDTAHADKGPNAQDSWIIYSRVNGLLGDHAITRGRDPSERVSSVTTFTGQSLKGRTGSVALLALAETAGDYNPATDKEVSAAGRAQGIASPFGKGRVVILGEAAMLTAQIEGNVHFGMQRAGNDNRQFALNTLHWLSRLLK
ncbi:MAG TPA: hypothetical protein DC054_02010 [Blastocatellia bacterium]|nr:hypothetical protein [Blastocatellia bacterium]